MKPRFLQTLPASGKLSGIVFFLMLGFLTLSARAQTPTHYEPTLESLNQHPLPPWYADAKLGIFVHWGLYSVPGWAPLVHPEHDFTHPDYIKNNPYAEWYLNTMRIDGSPNPGLPSRALWRRLRLLQFCSHLRSGNSEMESRRLGQRLPRRGREICGADHQTSRRIYAMAQLDAEPHAACRPATRDPRSRWRFDQGREQGRAADGALLLRRLRLDFRTWPDSRRRPTTSPSSLKAKLMASTPMRSFAN